MADTPIPIPGLPFADMVRVSMFEMQQSKGGDRSGVPSDMFDLDDDQRKLVRKHLALPKVYHYYYVIVIIDRVVL